MWKLSFPLDAGSFADLRYGLIAYFGENEVSGIHSPADFVQSFRVGHGEWRAIISLRAGKLGELTCPDVGLFAKLVRQITG